MRVFIAIDIDDNTRAALSQLQEEVIKAADLKEGDVKWVEPRNVHLTLKFLGDVRDEKIVEVCKMVEQAAAGNDSFDIDIAEVGFFGRKSANILWVGAGLASEQLNRLAGDIDENISRLGWPKEARKFAGHLTLGRIRNTTAGEKIAKHCGDYKDYKLGTITVSRVVVYQSELMAKGPVYTAIGKYKLKT